MATGIDLNVEYLSSPVNSSIDENAELEEDQEIAEPEDEYDGIAIDLIVDVESLAQNDSHSRGLAFDLNENPPIDDINHSINSDGLNLTSEDERPRQRKRELKNDERLAIYNNLVMRSVDGKLKRDTTTKVAEQFSVSIRTVQRIWKQAKENIVDGVVDVSHKKTKNCGRKRVQIDLDQLRSIPLKKRTTLRSLAAATHVGKTSLFRLLKSGELKRHTNPIKSDLTEDNKKARLRFCLSMLDQTSLPLDPMFASMHNIVHIDEKWFYLTKKTENYYLVNDEEDPLRTCKSKNFIGKVMFLVAVARPRFDVDGKEVFSGKIGVFPFITYERAKRTSANRVAGTLEAKPITSINKDVVRSFLIEKVLPAIREKWPRGEEGPIFIQQDNAKTHVRPDDPEFCAAASVDGFDIRLMCQPPNSPDLNVLDLGFFSAIQSLQYKECPKNIDELVAAVVRSYDDFSVIKSNRVFLTLQSCMIEILKVRGSNKYKIPHMKKEILEREGRLPLQSKCDATLVHDIASYLDGIGD